MMDADQDRDGSTPAPEAPARFGIHGLLVFVAVFLLAVPFGLIVLLLRVKVAWLRHVDVDTANDLHTFDEHHHAFVTTMKAVSDVGSSIAWIVILTTVGIWLLYRRLYRLVAFLMITAIGSSLLNNAIKAAVGRTRPVLVDPVATASGKSFPSGHTQSAIVGYGILVLIFLPAVGRRRRPLLVALATLMVLLIGFSRIALGVHYLSDVVGALGIGGAWLFAMTAAFSAWRRELKLPPVQPTKGLEPEHAAELTPDT